jgi:hypothetical protein
VRRDGRWREAVQLQRCETLVPHLLQRGRGEAGRLQELDFACDCHKKPPRAESGKDLCEKQQVEMILNYIK